MRFTKGATIYGDGGTRPLVVIEEAELDDADCRIAVPERGQVDMRGVTHCVLVTASIALV